jgi:hypothetical protein
MSAEGLELGMDTLGDDAFDLDVRIAPAVDRDPPGLMASGTCGGCPKWSAEGSSCAVSCHTCFYTDPTCDAVGD